MACSKKYKPSVTLLKSSLRNQFKEYPRVAALHGIAYIADPTRPKAERIGWFICIVASAIAVAGIIFTLMERFQTDPMMNSMELRFDDGPLDMPRFYICPPWELFNDIPSSKKYDRKFYKQLFYWDFVQPAKNITYSESLDDGGNLRKLFIQIAPSCEQFIPNSTLLSVEEKQLNCSFYDLTVTTAGICFTLPTSKHITEEEPFSFNFNTTMFPTKIYASLGEDTQLLRHLQLHTFRFAGSVKTEFQETRTSPDARMLTRSQRKCFFPGEQSPYGTCVLDCKIANSLKFCDCVPWYLANDDIKECQISRYACLESNSAEIMDISKCRCRQSCDNVVLKNTEVEVFLDKNLCTINVKARSQLKFKRTVRFGWADLFVSFGGIAGLFLGCSLLSIIELGYYFSLRTYCGAVLEVPKHRHNVIKINVLDVAHPVSLTRNQKRRAPLKKRVTFYDYVN